MDGKHGSLELLRLPRSDIAGIMTLRTVAKVLEKTRLAILFIDVLVAGSCRPHCGNSRGEGVGFSHITVAIQDLTRVGGGNLGQRLLTLEPLPNQGRSETFLVQIFDLSEPGGLTKMWATYTEQGRRQCGALLPNFPGAAT